MMKYTDRINRAIMFAERAHAGQVRKYTGDPYVTHPIAVAALLVEVVDATEDMLVAAILHDVVEDTPVTLAEIEAAFGANVARMVEGMTKVTTLEHGNRAVRKDIELQRLAALDGDVQTIKFADLSHNAMDINDHDPDFGRVFNREMAELVAAMTKGDARMRDHAFAVLHKNGFNQ